VSISFINDPKHWYDRAAEMRVLSETMNDIRARAMMLGLANDYDKLADRASERATTGPAERPSARPPSPQPSARRIHRRPRLSQRRACFSSSGSLAVFAPSRALVLARRVGRISRLPPKFGRVIREEVRSGSEPG
jgi:hypothetical protein